MAKRDTPSFWIGSKYEKPFLERMLKDGMISKMPTTKTEKILAFQKMIDAAAEQGYKGEASKGNARQKKALKFLNDRLKNHPLGKRYEIRMQGGGGKRNWLHQARAFINNASNADGIINTSDHQKDDAMDIIFYDKIDKRYMETNKKDPSTKGLTDKNIEMLTQIRKDFGLSDPIQFGKTIDHPHFHTEELEKLSEPTPSGGGGGAPPLMAEAARPEFRKQVDRFYKGSKLSEKSRNTIAKLIQRRNTFLDSPQNKQFKTQEILDAQTMHFLAINSPKQLERMAHLMDKQEAGTLTGKETEELRELGRRRKDREEVSEMQRLGLEDAAKKIGYDNPESVPMDEYVLVQDLRSNRRTGNPNVPRGIRYEKRTKSDGDSKIRYQNLGSFTYKERHKLDFIDKDTLEIITGGQYNKLPTPPPPTGGRETRLNSPQQEKFEQGMDGVSTQPSNIPPEVNEFDGIYTAPEENVIVLDKMTSQIMQDQFTEEQRFEEQRALERLQRKVQTGEEE